MLLFVDQSLQVNLHARLEVILHFQVFHESLTFTKFNVTHVSVMVTSHNVNIGSFILENKVWWPSNSSS